MSIASGDGSLIAAFLAELRRDLPAGSGRRRILAEVGAHLEDGVEAARAAGLPGPDAERRAVERFGSPGDLARQLAADLAAAGARGAAAVAALAVAGMVGLWVIMGSVARTPPWPGAALPDGAPRPDPDHLGRLRRRPRRDRPGARLQPRRAATGRRRRLARGRRGLRRSAPRRASVVIMHGEYVESAGAVAAIAAARVAVTLVAADARGAGGDQSGRRATA